MSGKFNPFQSKQAEVVRTHTVSKQTKALKIFEKLQRKRPYVWVETLDIVDPAAEQKLNELNGETSVALFIEAISDKPIWISPRPVLDALINRLWKHFNKLHIIQRVEKVEESAPEAEEE
jgi:signal recognition particle GTPase